MHLKFRRLVEKGSGQREQWEALEPCRDPLPTPLLYREMSSAGYGKVYSSNRSIALSSGIISSDPEPKCSHNRQGTHDHPC